MLLGASHTPTAGWGQVRAGTILLGAVTLIFLVNAFLFGGRFTGRDRRLWVAAQALGAGIFGLIGVALVIAGVVHLL